MFLEFIKAFKTYDISKYFYTEAVEKPIFHTKQSLMTSKRSIFLRTQTKKKVLLILSNKNLLLHDMHVAR